LLLELSDDLENGWVCVLSDDWDAETIAPWSGNSVIAEGDIDVLTITSFFRELAGAVLIIVGINIAGLVKSHLGCWSALDLRDHGWAFADAGTLAEKVNQGFPNQGWIGLR
jgi:hypothetical protein